MSTETGRRTAYCMKCKETKDMVEPAVETMGNGTKAVRGKCIKCGTGVYRFLGKNE